MQNSSLKLRLVFCRTYSASRSCFITFKPPSPKENFNSFLNPSPNLVCVLLSLVSSLYPTVHYIPAPLGNELIMMIMKNWPQANPYTCIFLDQPAVERFSLNKLCSGFDEFHIPIDITRVSKNSMSFNLLFL